jgi:nicotinamidase-related amidase
MAQLNYGQDSTALLFADPYNGFASEGGKGVQRLEPITADAGLLANLRAVGQAVRRAGMRIFIVPHRRWVPDDVVITEHWAQSGFANTDLDRQLRRNGITHVIIVGIMANRGIEATARHAMELGYHVTVVRDATQGVAEEMIHTGHKLIGPAYAHAIFETRDLVAALPQDHAARISPVIIPRQAAVDMNKAIMSAMEGA